MPKTSKSLKILFIHNNELKRVIWFNEAKMTLRSIWCLIKFLRNDDSRIVNGSLTSYFCLLASRLVKRICDVTFSTPPLSDWYLQHRGIVTITIDTAINSIAEREIFIISTSMNETASRLKYKIKIFRISLFIMYISWKLSLAGIVRKKNWGRFQERDKGVVSIDM